MSFGKTSSINLAGRSLHKRHGEPQHAMAEIERMLSQKISGQIAKGPVCDSPNEYIAVQSATLSIMFRPANRQILETPYIGRVLRINYQLKLNED
jgi:hypothetical protein